jgi:hypothetical protein
MKRLAANTGALLVCVLMVIGALWSFVCSIMSGLLFPNDELSLTTSVMLLFTCVSIAAWCLYAFELAGHCIVSALNKYRSISIDRIAIDLKSNWLWKRRVALQAVADVYWHPFGDVRGCSKSARQLTARWFWDNETAPLFCLAPVGGPEDGPLLVREVGGVGFPYHPHVLRNPGFWNSLLEVGPYAAIATNKFS